MEKEFSNNLEKINQKTKLIQKNLEQAKLRIKTQAEMMEKAKKTAPEKRVVLPANKEAVIQEILADMWVFKVLKSNLFFN